MLRPTPVIVLLLVSSPKKQWQSLLTGCFPLIRRPEISLNLVGGQPCLGLTGAVQKLGILGEKFVLLNVVFCAGLAAFCRLHGVFALMLK